MATPTSTALRKPWKTNVYNVDDWDQLNYNPVTAESLGLGYGESGGVTGQESEILRNSGAWGSLQSGKKFTGNDAGVFKNYKDPTGNTFYVQRPRGTQANKYDYERATYKLVTDKDGNQHLEQAGAWKPYDERSTKETFKDFAEKAAITAAAAATMGAAVNAAGGAAAGGGAGASGAGAAAGGGSGLSLGGSGAGGLYGVGAAEGGLSTGLAGGGLSGGSGLYGVTAGAIPEVGAGIGSLAAPVAGTGATGLYGVTAGAIPEVGGGIGSLANPVPGGNASVGGGFTDVLKDAGSKILDKAVDVGKDAIIDKITGVPGGSRGAAGGQMSLDPFKVRQSAHLSNSLRKNQGGGWFTPQYLDEMGPG